MELDREVVRRAAALALGEDLGGAGDVTSAAVVEEGGETRAGIEARSGGTLAGSPVAAEVFAQTGARFLRLARDGDVIVPGQVIARVEGPLRAILAAERTALNFLGRLSGVATQAARFVAAVGDTGVRVRDTRKTTPGLRALEKYAASVGGCDVHRMGLFEGMFLKDNHVAAAGGVTEAVRRAREARPDLPVLVEVETPEQAEEAVRAGAEQLLLDNMTLEQVRRTVARVGGRARLEASGGITLENARAVAETGVEAISAGAITHGAPWLDFSLEVEPS